MFNPPAKTPEDYRDRAEACERLAKIGNETTRETMQYLALRWRIKAAEAEAEDGPPVNATFSSI